MAENTKCAEQGASRLSLQSGSPKPVASWVPILILASATLTGCKLSDANGSAPTVEHTLAIESVGAEQDDKPDAKEEQDKGKEKGSGKDSGNGDKGDSKPHKTTGLPPNGPDFMYLPAPDLPQLQNRDPRFRAPVQMVSGTERYIDGEYQYTDFVYDDMSTVYPDGSDRTSPLWPRYHGNAADLFEFRLSTRKNDNLGFRFTLNTLMEQDSTIITMAFDSDDNPETGSDTLPRDPGMPFPGTDQVLTTWGTGAEWSVWNGSGWDTTSLQVSTDLEANQITVSVPSVVANPTGQWRATLATGLYDTTSGGWLELGGAVGTAFYSVPVSVISNPKIVNLGFRFNEVPPPPKQPISLLQIAENDPDAPPNGAPFNKQDAALAAGEPTRFSHLIDFDMLRARESRDNVPKSGMLYRLFPSHMKKVLASSDAYPPNGNPEMVGEGKDMTSLNGMFLSPIQPYALYVPETYTPDRPALFTFFLHCDGCWYWNLGDPGNAAVEVMGTARDSLVVMPQGRGKSGFYFGYGEVDALEAWADVARHYVLDPTRPAISGGSGGGGGTYQIALKWPHLFARALPIVPPMCRGLWTGVNCTGGYETVHAHWAENARNLPIFQIADSLSELTFYPGTVQLVQGVPGDGFNSFDELGYRYKLWSLAADHLLAAFVYPGPVTEFLGQYQIEQEPFHVTYVRMPSNDLPDVGLIHNRAYWLSGIEVRDDTGTVPGASANPCIAVNNACKPLARGVIDAVSLGFGKSDPASTQYVTPGMTSGPVALPYVETRRVWDEPGEVPVENRIVIKATNIDSVTIDPVAARVDCDVAIDIDSDGPIEVQLKGCP